MSAPERDAQREAPERRAGLLTRGGALAGRHLGLVGGCALVAVVIAFLVVTARPGTYVAEARLLVGTFEVPSEAIPGYVLASQSLAANYERLAETELVAGRVGEQLGLDPAEVRRQISVTAIPDSAILRVNATSTDEAEARRMADAMAAQIDAAVDGLAVQGDSGETLTRFEEATRELVAAQLVETEARATLTNATTSGIQAAITAAQQNVTDAELAVATAELTAESVADEYLLTQQRSSSSSGVRTLGGSIVTEASRLTATLTAYILAGLMGAAVGLGLAWRKERHGAAPNEAEAARKDTEDTEDADTSASAASRS